MKGLFIRKGEVLYKLTKPEEEKDTKAYKMEDFDDLIVMGLDTEASEELFVVGSTQEEFQSVIDSYFNKVEGNENEEQNLDK